MTTQITQQTLAFPSPPTRQTLGGPNHPPLVQRLEETFLAHVRQEINSAQFISEDRRQEIVSLLGSGASARAVGNKLFLAHQEDLLRPDSSDERFGKTRVIGHTFIEPDQLQTTNLPHHSLTLTQMQKRRLFLETITGLSKEERWILEAKFSTSTTSDEIGNQQIEDVKLGLHNSFHPFGLTFFEIDSERNIIIRIPSLTITEIGLRIFFGKQAVQLCMVPGATAGLENNRLHAIGYHGIGVFLKKSFDQNFILHPGEFSGHDITHALEISELRPAWERVAGSLIGEFLETEIGPMHGYATLLVFGDLSFNYGIESEMSSLFSILSAQKIRALAQVFSEGVKKHVSQLDTEDQLKLKAFSAKYFPIPSF